MKQSTSKLLSSFQNTSLAEDAYRQVTGVDLNYLGNVAGAGDFILSDVEALKSKVLFWITSVQGDYVREPEKGGILYNLLGKTLNVSSLNNMKEAITSSFNEMFSKEFQLVNLQLTPNTPTRGHLQIVMVVKDLLSTGLFKVAVGVEI